MSRKQRPRWSRLTAGLFLFLFALFSCSQDSPIAPPDSSAPVLKPTALTVPAGAIVLKVGQNLQSIVSSKAAGAVFLVKAGVHNRQSIVPKNGMTFIGEPGAVLDGGGATQFAFSGSADNVTISNLEIRNYKPGNQTGAVRGGTSQYLTSGWIVEDSEVHHNSTGGIRTGHRMVIRRNYIHHNGQNGISGKGDDILVANNEVAFNGSTQYAAQSTGGSKFVKTHDLVVRNNDYHDNTENGIWMDLDCINSLIEGNQVIDNTGQGIMMEISYKAVIRNNYVEGNGFGRGRWLYGAGIMISSSPDAEVYGNTVKNNYNGITAVVQDRGSGTLGLHHVKNLYVHNNTITMKVAYTGLGIGGPISSVYYTPQMNNRFRNNTYNLLLGYGTNYFVWDGKKTLAEWKASGQS